MNETFDFSGKKVISAIVNRLGVIVCVGIIAFDALYRVFGGAELSFESALSIGSDVIIHVTSAWFCFATYHQMGNTKGKQCEEYLTVMAKYNTIRAEMVCRKNEISVWCEKYRNGELSKRRSDLLTMNDVTDEDFVKARKMRPLERRKAYLRYQRRAIRIAQKMKPLKLTAKWLLTGYAMKGTKGLAPHPLTVDAAKTSFSFVKILVMSVFAVNVYFKATLVQDPSEAILSSMVVLFSLCLACFSGYRQGYATITGAAVYFTSEQTEYLTICANDLKK